MGASGHLSEEGWLTEVTVVVGLRLGLVSNHAPVFRG
jgi:hypothetical protein